MEEETLDKQVFLKEMAAAPETIHSSIQQGPKGTATISTQMLRRICSTKKEKWQPDTRENITSYNHQQIQFL